MLKPDINLSTPDRDWQNQSKIQPDSSQEVTNGKCKQMNQLSIPEVPNPGSQRSGKKGSLFMANNSMAESMHCKRETKKRIYKRLPFWSTQHHYCTKNSFINYPNCASVHALGHTCFSDSAQAHRQVTRLANRKLFCKTATVSLRHY